jgi:hypothetical protein
VTAFTDMTERTKVVIHNSLYLQNFKKNCKKENLLFGWNYESGVSVAYII